MSTKICKVKIRFWKLLVALFCLILFVNVLAELFRIIVYFSRHVSVKNHGSANSIVFNADDAFNNQPTTKRYSAIFSILETVFYWGKPFTKSLKSTNSHIARYFAEVEMPKKTSQYVGLKHMDLYLNLPPKEHFNVSENVRLEYSQRRDYPVLISHDNECGKTVNATATLSLKDFDYAKDIFLLFVIKSTCASTLQRTAIRITWGNETWIKENLGVNTKRYFLMGDCTSDKGRQEVFQENKIYNDILQWKFFDSFQNLTLKDCLFLQWFTRFCRNVPYIFKGDDDVFVNPPNVVKLLKDLELMRRDNFIQGSVVVRSKRIIATNSKYYVSSNLYAKRYYPPYISGGSFVMSNRMAVRLFQASLKARIIPIDDAFLGILLQNIGVKPQDDTTFGNFPEINQTISMCDIASHYKTLHSFGPKEMIEMWKKYTEQNDKKCVKT